jgi:LPPG:FO 2-phospho-L-lactate transferase
MHIERTRLLAEGNSLTDVTTRLATALGISHPIFPMCNQSQRTRVRTEDEMLDFQTYFVRKRCAPVVKGFEFDGAANTRMNPDLVAWLQEASPTGIILCPSNPYVSIDPILQVNGMRDFLVSSDAPVIAVSPVVGGDAIKGPTVKMMQELGIPNTAQSVASHYIDFLDGFVLDLEDQEHAASIREEGIAAVVTQTVMRSLNDRVALARDCLECIHQLSNR